MGNKVNDIDKDNLKLVYVKPITDGKDYYEYNFLFSDTPDVVWGIDWNDNAPNLCGDISPEPSTYNVVKSIKSILPFNVIQNNSCYSMEYAINRSVALSYINLEGLEEYPETRLVFHFGDSYSYVENELLKMNIVFEK
jgi:hypothetical protein